MPVFGKSLFETVLSVLDAEEQDLDEDGLSPDFSPRNAWAGFVGLERDTGVDATGAGANPYDDFAPDPAPKEVPSWIERLSEDEIAADLDLEHCKSESDIRDRRRLFSRSNHPDRVEEEYRAAATIRMMIANQLIDRALEAKIRV